MALQALKGRHFRRIHVGIVAVPATILFKSRVQIGFFSFVGMAIRARPVSLIFEQFIAWRRMGVVTLYTIGAHCRFPMPAPLLVVVALNAKRRDLFFEKFFQ
jgi:hypothetical protein